MQLVAFLLSLVSIAVLRVLIGVLKFLTALIAKLAGAAHKTYHDRFSPLL